MKVIIIFITALAVMLQTIDGRSMCPVNEKLFECGTACEPSCDRPVIPVFQCTLQCIVNECQCIRGFVRDPKEGCIPPQFCPKQNTTDGLPKKG
ncbi:hypothetical protein CAEBREN_10742 [Caenorhabditis brenneri]|uniref:TIL domain-containing protein n=1 Tax=Caenorhabditis brenneri TaxID=135651 RepID=G0M8D3_CAEBE|nr:hypothetical protein CAEBREN_10742 [Caenorhabditis brenneri]